MKKYSKVHRCADENEGYAMWFHKKGRISGDTIGFKCKFNDLLVYSY